MRNFEVFSSNNSSLNPYTTHQSIGPLPSCFAVWWSEQTILADGVFEAMEMDEQTFIPPLTASMPEMLPGGHKFEFPASMFFFVSSTADKKENKVNSQNPATEKCTRNKDVVLTLDLLSSVLHSRAFISEKWESFCGGAVGCDLGTASEGKSGAPSLPRERFPL